MEKTKEEILLERYLSGRADKQEQAMVESWYLDVSDEAEAPSQSMLEKAEVQVWNRLSVHRHKNGRNRQWLMAAASIVLCIGFGLYFYKQSAKETQVDIPPGKNSATLTLSDGRKIALSSEVNGNLAEEAGVKISKTTDGQIVYNIQPEPHNGKTGVLKMNTLSTTRGEQYQVRLPDGTKVWLNAASSLTYPTTLNGGGDRKVELNGEAYFEVASLSRKGGQGKVPFIVKTILLSGDARGQEVEVLGTHFNINSYNDEPQIKTTLLEGSVRVLNLKSKISGLLKPGQQSVIQATDNSIQIIAVDADEAISWKNGDFYFDNERLESIMKKISRWYNVDVEFQDLSKKNAVFGGYISRSSHISKVLKMLELTGLAKFTITNNKVVVR
ncbi:FecR family protein [Pedobacter punctiformis]|uniref:DUF4974 domain-containing protein n=1 Tax=Pedobacter punctiformis TaxID=3004097 RepID=A0ABT4LAU2_9SPHI|nr:FecR family protein [Pedobacter sp. HCMS5-2]MCZ4245040.1 DUF4974 domain-containing protein [Pedobacter sp. HCMS5-2]